MPLREAAFQRRAAGISVRDPNHHGRSLRSATDGCAGTEGHGKSKNKGEQQQSILSAVAVSVAFRAAGLQPAVRDGTRRSRRPSVVLPLADGDARSMRDPGTRRPAGVVAPRRNA
jgi:hypothetical protein